MKKVLQDRLARYLMLLGPAAPMLRINTAEHHAIDADAQSGWFLLGGNIFRTVLLRGLVVRAGAQALTQALAHGPNRTAGEFDQPQMFKRFCGVVKGAVLTHKRYSVLG